jgi:asparagine synthase (glutamine-hydrolysing)
MCGIAGIVNKNKVDNELIIKMTDIISHRGPDGEGHWFNEDGNVALGHRRLSIIDLTEGGKQPMHYAERFTITFNGEIYNYIELKDMLVKQGFIFKSDSDTEVLLALYTRDGSACLNLLDGMFAFAIYDKLEKRLFCARDRFGEKPFFYSYKPGQYFMFGSEIKQLFAAGISREFNSYQLYNYLENAHILSNPSDEHETFYADVKKLPKSSFIIVNDAIQIKEEKYWEIDLTKKSFIKYEEAVDEFRSVFLESVKRRMRSDVPVGSSLSGGLDSSSIVCSIQKLFGNGNLNQKTFSARFENFDRDEGKFIQYVLDNNNVTPFSVWPSEEGFLNDIDSLMFHQDEPFPSASIYAQYCVMAEAKRQDVIVLLDGQGADEILGGYEYYLPYYLKELAVTNKSLFDEEMRYMEVVHPHLKFENGYSAALQGEKEIAKKASIKEGIKNSIRPLYKLVNPKKYKHIYSLLPLNTFYDETFFNKISDQKRYDFLPPANDMNKFLKHSVEKDNLEDLLRFCDRNSMAHSREVRLPFLSSDLVEFLFSLPASYKIRNGWTKAIMRDAMHGILPMEIERRTDKIGYEPPQKKWMTNKKITDKIHDSYEVLVKNNILKPSALQDRKLDWQVINIATLIK